MAAVDLDRAVAAAEEAGGAPWRAPSAALVGGADGQVVLRLGGDWLLARGETPALPVRQELERLTAARRLAFDSRDLGRWDTVLPSFLTRLVQAARERGIEPDLAGLPDGAARLVALATAVAPAETPSAARPGLLHRVGEAAIGFFASAADMGRFMGEVAVALGRLVRGRARLRGRDFWLAVQQVGAEALPIVALVGLLVGMILAFIGGAQLAIFGAEVYVANLVTLGMAREMGPMMAAVLMSGRTGAAFAAELGTMQVNEEIDALKTMGISPMEFLVLPRLLALALMMPLLALYANAFGILGGGIVAVGLLDLSPAKYLSQSLLLIGLHDFAGGLVKAFVFGLVVAVAGCLQGIRSGRNAAAVGASATAAVVNGIVGVIVCDAILNLVYNVLGI